MKESSKKNWIIITCLVLVFSFFFGFYISYRITEKEKSKLDIIREIMEEEWYYGVDEEDIESSLENKMILGMIDLNKDPYTRYLTSLGSLADSYTGVGISASLYGEYFIIDEVSSQSAINCGLKVGDIIVGLDDINLENKSLEELNDLIVNKESVNLKILRNSEEINITAPITTYDPITVFTKEYDDVSYVKISEFNMDTAEYLNEYFNGLASNYNNLIIDLRGNPGGYISSVRDVLDLFVSSDKVVMSTVDKNGKIKFIKTVDDSLYIFNKIVVLIDENSASGAEALSAALDYHLDDIVTLYGNTTYGKGSAQKTYHFDDGTYFHYTYALWNTPFGNTINHIGVAPEVESVNTGISHLKIYNKELNLYDYGEEVLSIQRLLNMLGYYQGPLHSFVDENVYNSLKEFQKDNNLTQTGIVDNETLRYINKLMYDDKVLYLDNELNDVLRSMFS